MEPRSLRECEIARATAAITSVVTKGYLLANRKASGATRTPTSRAITPCAKRFSAVLCVLVAPVAF
jgi:hypothetical protein